MAHIHEKIDWCVGAYIVHNHTVLIRLHDKYNVWAHVGGHVELDEDPITAVKRECLEEVGLTITLHNEKSTPSLTDYIESVELPIPAHMNIHRINDTHQHIDLIYYAHCDSSAVVPEDANDVWEWLTKEEVENHPTLSDRVRTYALGALATYV
jgi:8-oxo-dGTP pyrophosphatase MutT (NUDIX family)